MQKDQKVFRLTAQIAVRQEDFGGLAFVPYMGEVIQLNPLAYRLLKQLISTKIVRALPENLDFWQGLETKGIVSEVVSDG